MSRRRWSVLLGIRVGLLLAAAGAVASALVLAETRARLAGQGPPAFACPMHPEIQAASDSGCPLCGMALVRKPPLSHAGGTWSLPSGSGLPEAALGRATALAVARQLVAPAWVEPAPGGGQQIVALLYNDEVALLAAEQAGRFRRWSASPEARSLEVGLLPGVSRRWDQATSHVRWRLLADARLNPGETGWLELTPPDREMLVVPEGALLQSPEGPYLLVPAGGGQPALERRAVVTGRSFFGFVTVLAGLQREDRFVAEGAILFDTERRMTEQPAPGERPR